MTSENIPPSNRIYSPARMKRREIKSKIQFSDSDVGRELDSSVNNVEDVDEAELYKGSTGKAAKIDPDTENIKPTSGVSNLDIIHSASSEMEVPVRSNYKSIREGSFESEESIKDLVRSEKLEKIKQKKLSTDIENQKLKTLASLLPDEVLRYSSSTVYHVYETAVMFPDVSGFTQLCQKYDKTGKGGPSRLTAVLNGYIGSMIKIVLSKNGDVLKFGGDAFLCTWKVTKDSDLSEMVHLAIESAIEIQKHCGEHNTDVGVKLRVKVAVAAGSTTFSIIGSKSRKHYVIFGPPILDVREAENLCKAGDVIVSPSAWKFVKNYMLYSFTYHSDGKHIKVHDFGPLWTRRSNIWKNKNGLGTRAFLRHNLNFKIEDLRPFILPPVMRSIDQDRPLEYLTEMRQVAIVFFNVVSDIENMLPNQVVSLSSRVFQIVSRMVSRAGGGTNKLTLFDKDMAILTVFGLKGFKHALASQVALKCAFACLEELKKLNVQSVSAGVTTGMAYCGVIGHLLRKEYTVMGHPVNMAARLMCAYQNIVSCDRSTFLNSKLESGHFEVLHVEYLKGIQNVGPFYKFNIRPLVKIKVGQEDNPLLGRVKEIEAFQQFLRNTMKHEKAEHFFIVYGSARIGKTRLVQHLLSVTQNWLSKEYSMPLEKINKLHVIALQEDDSKASYSTIRLIFEPLLGLGNVSSVEEREDKILTKLKSTNDFTCLASYNQIFNVKFELSPQYLALKHTEQAVEQMNYLKNLYNECFDTDEKWVIVIDDAEFIDDESWQFLLWCSEESQKAVYILTVGEKKFPSNFAASALEKIKAKKIALTEIDKWFYVGLACQILDVEAIPVELENLLQQYKSSGNPGWLESFLLSLIQSRSIYTTSIYSRKMKTLGLVAPPDFMLRSGNVKRRGRENSVWVDCVETFETSKFMKRNKIRVCLLGPEFSKLSDNEDDLTMDVMFIKTIDTLEPLEQLVLKAGSVMGNTLDRKILEHVIAAEITIDKRELAKAIQHLFEIKIISCAKGDSNQNNKLLSKRTLLEHSVRKVMCECEGLEIADSCLDLPKYANCGYMQFCSSSFRETLYNLLLDNQKKKFHNSCIEYLRENTRRCKKCKGVLIDNVYGFEVDNKIELACAKTGMFGVRGVKIDPVTKQPIVVRPRRSYQSSSKTPDKLIRTDTEDIVEIPEGVCQCPEILAAVYFALLEHAAGSGRKDLILEIQFEYAAVNLTMRNIPVTLQILEDARVIANKIKEENEHPELCSDFIYSKIFTLMGASKLYMGRLDDSLELLLKALNLMQKSFPSSNFKTRLLIQREILSLEMNTGNLRKYNNKEIGKTVHYTELLSQCLGLISTVHMYNKNLIKAKYASLSSLNKAIKSSRNFYALCTAYANVIEGFYCSRNLKACDKLEGLAITLCKEFSYCYIELYEWEAISRLYKVIFQVRYARGEIEGAIQIGFQSIKIASVISSTSLKLDLYPDLINALLLTHRHSEAVTLLQELDYMSRLDSDKTSRLWYYSICLDFQLYTGFTILPYSACEDFIKTVDSCLVRDPQAKHKLYASMWVWCVRNSEWELIKAHGKNLKAVDLFAQADIPMNVFVRLQTLEGLLVLLVHKLDSRSLQSINPIYIEIHQFLKRIQKDVKFLKLLKPRFLLFKSYYKEIRFRGTSGFSLLNKALDLAEKINDQSTIHWIGHTKLLWTNAISHIQREYWNEHCRESFLEWHEFEKETKRVVYCYSLPLPRF